MVDTHAGLFAGLQRGHEPVGLAGMLDVGSIASPRVLVAPHRRAKQPATSRLEPNSLMRRRSC